MAIRVGAIKKAAYEELAGSGPLTGTQFRALRKFIYDRVDARELERIRYGFSAHEGVVSITVIMVGESDDLDVRLKRLATEFDDTYLRR